MCEISIQPYHGMTVNNFTLYPARQGLNLVVFFQFKVNVAAWLIQGFHYHDSRFHHGANEKVSNDWARRAPVGIVTD